MSVMQGARFCAKCDTRLARDNTGDRCSSCARATRDLPGSPPKLPREFWDTDRMRDAFTNRHMGQVIGAYRHHSYHGRQLSQAEVADWLGITQPALSRMEKKVDPPKDLPKLISYAQLLGMPAELLWFKLPDVDRLEAAEWPMQAAANGGLPLLATATYTHEQAGLIVPEQSGPVDRREFLIASAGAGAAAMAPAPAPGFLASLSQAAPPATIRSADIEQVRSAAGMFRAWNNAYGGAAVQPAVIAQLRWSAELLEARCPQRLRPALFSAVGDFSLVCGFIAFDGYQFDDAKHMFAFGMSCAEEAGDWHLRARLLSNIAHLAIWRGDPEAALTSTETALVRPDRLSSLELAFLHARRARSLALLGRPDEAVRAIYQADEVFASNASEVPPRWMEFYDPAEHAAETGWALSDMAAHGTALADAGGRLRTAVAGHGPAYTRARVLNGTRLATLLFLTGDPREATAVGSQALDASQGVRSRRVGEHLRQLQQAASTHEKVPEVRELHGRITELVGAV